MNCNPLLVALCALPVLMSCSVVEELADNINGPVAEPVLVKVKPELDYSAESPDCATAGQRLKDNVELGMPLDEVIRLVGKPQVKFPGSWWWTNTFSNTGLPVVKFPLGYGAGNKPVTSFTSDTEGCDTQ